MATFNSSTQTNKTYATVLSDGKIHQQVPEGTDGAIVREVEKEDGTKKNVTELVHNSITGKITHLSLAEGKFGDTLNVVLDDEVVLKISVVGKYGEDFMRKLRNVDLTKALTIAPYSFEDKETGKNKKGITMTQNDADLGDIKLSNYYVNEDKEPINGYPKFDGNKNKKDDWKIYGMRVSMFLKEQTASFINDNFNKSF